MSPRSRLLPGLALLALLGLSALQVGCRSEPERPHVILITADTLRADHLGCYGYGRNTSPRIDALARSSTLFLDCTSPANSTNPSFSSMHSGTFVKTHGVVALSTFGYRLNDSLQTMAEILADEGYVTVAAVSAHHLAGKLSGLGQGFHHYFDVEDQRLYKQPAPVTNERVVPLLRTLYGGRERSERPLFLWMHYFDPHTPYDPPAERLDQVLGGEEVPEGELEELIARYDGEIAFMDRAIGELLDVLEELGLGEDALVMFTADHGENLGEHGEVANHAHLYDPVVRVPLLIRLAGQTEGRTVASPVQTVDLHPTVSAVVGRKGELPDQVEGRDLSPLLRGEETDPRRLVYSEGSSFKERMVRSDTHKLTYDVRRDAYQLFDRASDPAEEMDLSREAPEIRRELAAALEAFVGPLVIDVNLRSRTDGDLLVRIRGASDLWPGESSLGDEGVMGKVGHGMIEARCRLEGGSPRSFTFGHRGGPVDVDARFRGDPVPGTMIAVQGVRLSNASRVLLRIDLEELIPGGDPPSPGGGLSAAVNLTTGEGGERVVGVRILGEGGAIEGRLLADRSWSRPPVAGPETRLVPLSEHRMRFVSSGKAPVQVQLRLPPEARILLLEARERLADGGERPLDRAHLRAAFRSPVLGPTFLLPAEAFTAPGTMVSGGEEQAGEPLVELRLRRSSLAADWTPIHSDDLDEATRQRMILLGYLEEKEDG